MIRSAKGNTYGKAGGAARVAEIGRLPGALPLGPTQRLQLGELLALGDEVVDRDETALILGAGQLEQEDLVLGQAVRLSGLERRRQQRDAGEEGARAG